MCACQGWRCPLLRSRFKRGSPGLLRAQLKKCWPRFDSAIHFSHWLFNHPSVNLQQEKGAFAGEVGKPLKRMQNEWSPLRHVARGGNWWNWSNWAVNLMSLAWGCGLLALFYSQDISGHTLGKGDTGFRGRCGGAPQASFMGRKPHSVKK